MAEKSIIIQSAGPGLEALFDNVPGHEAVVVTHPHPVYGGDMHNNVVASVVAAYRREGYSTLRFNFRGVGRSEGRHDQGVGERDDVKAALSYLADQGKSSIDLVGYSFGAWVNALGLPDFEQAQRLVMVAPPVDFSDFSAVEPSPRIRLVIAGENDEIASSDKIRRLLPSWNPQAELEIIEGADHFFYGSTAEITEAIVRFLS